MEAEWVSKDRSGSEGKVRRWKQEKVGMKKRKEEERRRKKGSR